MTWISRSFGYFLAIVFMNFMNSPVRFPGALPREARADDFAGEDFESGEQVRGSVPDVVVRALLGFPKETGSSGWVCSRAWTCVFSSKESTTALSGGFR